MNFLAAFIAKPFEVVNLTGPALAFKDDKPGIGFKARRVRHAGRAEENLAGFYVRGLFFAIGCSIDQMLRSGQLQRHFVRRVDMKVPALLATAAQKRNRLRILPKTRRPLPSALTLSTTAVRSIGISSFMK